MPYGSRYYRRRTYRRKYYPRRRMSWLSRKRFSQRRRGIGANALRFFKIRDGPTLLTTDASGVLASTYTDNLNFYTDWTSMAALFDTYRVHAIKINYYPGVPNDLSSTTNYLPIYIVGDVNDTTALTSADQAIQYENCKILNMFAPWSYYFKIPKRLSTSTARDIEAGGYIDVNDVGSTCAIKYYADGLDVSSTYGSLIGTAYVSMKNRK